MSLTVVEHARVIRECRIGISRGRKKKSDGASLMVKRETRKVPKSKRRGI